MSRELLQAAAARLSAAGVASPRVDAELLLAHVLGTDRGRLVTATPATRQREVFAELVERRAAREPLQHLLGTAAFRHLILQVGPGVFVPRPETELLVDAVLPALRTASRPVAVDLCSGSGALALALATEVPNSRVVAVERSESALGWLRRNADHIAVRDRLRIVAGDIADPRLQSDLVDLSGAVDVVVCNPPYVPTATVVGPEVSHDPPDAVFAGSDGLDLVPDVIRLAARLLKPAGVLAMEHDDTQGNSVPALLHGAGTDSAPTWTAVTDHRDLTGRARFVTATRG